MEAKVNFIRGEEADKELEKLNEENCTKIFDFQVYKVGKQKAVARFKLDGPGEASEEEWELIKDFLEKLIPMEEKRINKGMAKSLQDLLNLFEEPTREGGNGAWKKSLKQKA